MPSWKVRWNSSDLAKSWMTSARHVSEAGAVEEAFWSLSRCSILYLRPHGGFAGNVSATPVPCDLDHFAPPNSTSRRGCGLAKQGLGRRPAGLFPLYLCRNPSNFRLEDVDALFQFGHAEQFQ